MREEAARLTGTAGEFKGIATALVSSPFCSGPSDSGNKFIKLNRMKLQSQAGPGPSGVSRRAAPRPRAVPLPRRGPGSQRATLPVVGTTALSNFARICSENAQGVTRPLECSSSSGYSEPRWDKYSHRERLYFSSAECGM